jgi:hypothetical protein
MQVFIMVMVGLAVRMANGVIGCAVKVEHFMDDPFFFENAQDAVKGYPVNIMHYALQVGLGSGRIF